MSADAITICPVCAGKELNRPWRELTVEDLSAAYTHMTNQLRENYETYIDKGCVVHVFYCDCRECGWIVEPVTLTHRLPEPA